VKFAFPKPSVAVVEGNLAEEKGIVIRGDNLESVFEEGEQLELSVEEIGVLKFETCYLNHVLYPKAV
jgi:hypothetical protein